MTRALSGGGDPEIDTVELTPMPGERYLLCSDGLSGVVPNETIARMLGENDGGLDGICARLIAAANEAAAGPTTSPSSSSKSMLHNLAQLPRYRALIQSLVARELKARYRGSVLGFFWSFINPLTAAADLHVRVHLRDAGRERHPRTDPTRCSCSADCCRGPGSPRR